jgi:hypothetical protein
MQKARADPISSKGGDYMTKVADDLDAVRTIVGTLEPFGPEDQERIIRWAQEKLGLQPTPQSALATATRPLTAELQKAESVPAGQASDIKTFVAEKNPTSDNQFAATVAYYYMFVAPESERKESVSGDDLQEACRLVGRKRLNKPGQTLINAHYAGLLDKAGDRGRYALNTVGENLVAMALPGGAAPQTPKITASKPKKTSKKKPAQNMKKTSGTKTTKTK